MVFDGKGELRSAYKLSDALTDGIKAGLSVPEALIATVDSGLEADCSLEELERRYVDKGGSGAAYLALREKLKQLAGVGFSVVLAIS